MNPSQFSNINKVIIEDVKKELRLQGHHDTGDLEQSLQDLFVKEDNGYTLSATALGYLQELEHGVSASQFNESKVDVNKLAGWVGRKILPGEFSGNAKAIAFAIIKKWKKEGKPLETSRQFSKNGNILNAVSDTFHHNDNKYYSMLDAVIVDDLDLEVLNTKSGVI